MKQLMVGGLAALAVGLVGAPVAQADVSTSRYSGMSFTICHSHCGNPPQRPATTTPATAPPGRADEANHRGPGARWRSVGRSTCGLLEHQWLRRIHALPSLLVMNSHGLNPISTLSNATVSATSPTR